MSWTQGLRARGIGLKLLALGAMLALVVGAMGVSTNGAAAQTFGGAGLKITSLGGGQVLVAWTGIGSGLTLLRITDVDATTAGTSTTLTATQTTLTDTVPAAANVACYLILGPGGSRSDLLCALLGLATSLGPDDISITLNQTNNATSTWVGPTGTTSWIVLALGVSTTTVTTPSVVIATGGTFTCIIILGNNTLSDGVCGLPGFTTGGGPTATPTPTACPTIPIVGTPLCIPTVPPTITPGGPTFTPAVTATPTASNTPTVTSTPTVTNTPAPVAITLTITDTPDPVAAGGQIRLVLRVTNVGGTTATDLQVVARAPVGTIILNADGITGGAYFGRCGSPANVAPPANPVVSCLGTLGAGVGTDIIVDVLVPIDAGCGTPLTSTGVADPNFLIINPAVTASTTTLRSGCATSTATPGPTVAPAGLTFTKTASPTNAVGGGGLTWTLSLTNTSGAPISGITVQDTIPGSEFLNAGAADVPVEGLALLGVTGTHGFICGPQTGGSRQVFDNDTAANNDNVVTPATVVVCGGGSIPDGQTATITLVTLVRQADCSGFGFGAFNSTRDTADRTNTGSIVAPAVANPVATRRPTCSTPTSTAVPPSPTSTATPIQGDLDVGFADNQACCADILNTTPAYQASSAFTFFNDGVVPITGITIAGSISGTAPRDTLAVTVALGAGNPAWVCTVPAAQTITWSCTGGLDGSAAAFQFNNLNDGGAATTVTIWVRVNGTVGSAGQTVVFTTGAPTCGAPTPCTDSVISPANGDGSDLTPGLWGLDTDTLL